MKLYTLLFLYILTVFSSCNGQNQKAVNIKSDQTNKTFTGDTVSELDKTIFVVFQAKDKNYWFGSDGHGVFRYDGKTILHFSSKHGLCNDRIREIKEDKSGNIFFTTLDGISKFDGQKFTTLTAIESNEWKLEPDDLWFKGKPNENAVYRFDGKSLYHLAFPKHYMEDEFYARQGKVAYSPYEVYTIYNDSKGNVWFGTSNFGICRYDGKSLSWMYEKHLTEIEGGGSFCIRSIIEDKEGKFWFCNTSYRYNILPASSTEQGKTLINYKREKGIDSLKAPNGNEMIYYMSIAEDNKRDLWMATYNLGVWRYDGKNITHYSVKDGSDDITLFSIYKDNNGELWLGTHEAGAYKFNGKTFEKFKP